MPDFPVDPLDLVGEGSFVFHDASLFDEGHELTGGNRELIIIELNDSIELIIMTVGHGLGVTCHADVFHIVAFFGPVFFMLGDRGPQRPGEALTHIVADLLFFGGGHMAGGAGGGLVIVFAHDPAVGLEVHGVYVGVECIAVFGLFVDLFLGMIRAQMAFAACFGATCLSFGEGVTGMACGAGTLGTIRVDAADT